MTISEWPLSTEEHAQLLSVATSAGYPILKNLVLGYRDQLLIRGAEEAASSSHEGKPILGRVSQDTLQKANRFSIFLEVLDDMMTRKDHHKITIKPSTT